MSSFATSHTHDLVSNAPALLSYENSIDGLSDEAERLQNLITLDGSTGPNTILDPKTLRTRIEALRNLQLTGGDDFHITDGETGTSVVHGNGEKELKLLLEEELFISLYAESLDAALKEAIEAENEMEWWADLERSWQNITWYLVQSMLHFLS